MCIILDKFVVIDIAGLCQQNMITKFVCFTYLPIVMGKTVSIVQYSKSELISCS